MISDPVREAANRVRDAFDNKGPNPAHHFRMMTKLSHEWPTLFYAVMILCHELNEEFKETDHPF